MVIGYGREGPGIFAPFRWVKPFCWSYSCGLLTFQPVSIWHSILNSIFGVTTLQCLNFEVPCLTSNAFTSSFPQWFASLKKILGTYFNIWLTFFVTINLFHFFWRFGLHKSDVRQQWDKNKAYVWGGWGWVK